VDAPQHSISSALLHRLSYLGRAESRVRARLVTGDEDFQDLSSRRGTQTLTTSRCACSRPWQANSPTTGVAGLAARPTILLAALQIDTNTLQKEGGTPPGTRETVYWRPASAFSSVSVSGSSDGRRQWDRHNTACLHSRPTRNVMSFPDGASRSRPMALFRRALLGRSADEQQLGGCPKSQGKTSKESR